MAYHNIINDNNFDPDLSEKRGHIVLFPMLKLSTGYQFFLKVQCSVYM